ncbi:hypothetical protein [Mycolicibacterium thermoresistibile]
MHARLRPYLTTGVALAGASVIAVAPSIAPLPPDITVQAAPAATAAAVDLAAVSNPLEALIQLFGNSAANTRGLFEAIAEAPAPILSQVLVNQFAHLQLIGATAEQIVTLLPQLVEAVQVGAGVFVEHIVNGEFIEAGDALSQLLLPLGLPLLGVIAPPLTILQNVTANIAAVPTAIIDNLFTAILPVIGLATSAIGATFDTAQGISDAFGEGDLLTAAGIIFSSPMILADAVLNGFGEGGIGVLTPPAGPFNWGGPIGALLELRNAIAGALNPVEVPTAQGQAAINQAPDPSAPVVALGVSKSEIQDGDSFGAQDGSEGNTEVSDGSDESDGIEEALNGTTATLDSAGNSVTISKSGEDGESGDAGADNNETTELAGPEADSERADDLKDVESLDKNVNGGTNLSDGNKATPSVTGETSAGSSSKNKLGETKQRPGVKKTSVSASATSSTDSGDE